MISYFIFAIAALIALYTLYDFLESKVKSLRKGGKPITLKKLLIVLASFLLVGGIILIFIKGNTVIQIIVTFFVFIYGAMKKMNIFLRILPFVPYFARRWQQRSSAGGGRKAHSSTMTLTKAASILGVSQNANKKDIINAYRQKMRDAHPDKGGSTEQAQELNAAREVMLKNVANN